MVPGSAKADGGQDRKAGIFHAQALKTAGCTFVGGPVSIEFLPNLSVHRRQLLSNCGVGHEVHAGSFLRERSIVIDSALRGPELTRILLHELFHFAWIR